MRDYYRILGIRSDATQDEIKEAWIFGVKAFHPDKFAGSSQRQQAVAQERTKAVNEAYDILSDATRRANHDREYARKTRAESTPPPSPRSAPPPPPRKTASSTDSGAPKDQASRASPPPPPPRGSTSAKDNRAKATRPAKTGSPGEQNRNEPLSTVSYGAALYVAWLIAAAMLVSAAVERHPYSFYMLLRWICCPIFAYSAFVAHEKNRAIWLWVFAALAVLYNPIFLVHLDRSTWIGVNWFTVGAIIVAAVAFLPRRGQIWIAAATGLVVVAVGLWRLQPVTRPQTSPSPTASAQSSLQTLPDGCVELQPQDAVISVHPYESPKFADPLYDPLKEADVKAHEAVRQYRRGVFVGYGEIRAAKPVSTPANAASTSPRDQTVEGSEIHYSLTVPADWTVKRKQQPSSEEAADFDLIASHKNVYVGVIAEEPNLGDLDTVVSFSRKLLKQHGTDVRLTEVETASIDGRTWRAFNAHATVEKIPFAYQFYVYTGPEGTFQLLGWTFENLFERDLAQLREVLQSFKFPPSKNGEKEYDMAGEQLPDAPARSIRPTGPKTYQFTGTVLKVTDTMIVVQKGKNRWEVNRDSQTKVTGDLKVGAEVTVTYAMSATTVR